ncbi:PDZ domain-containing protein [Arthrobacter sp. zg-Y820]|uniref:S41 family peptidase n=1 Tax=unclassified Arthrobacter TaxID=235627 RepID=UPI001E5C0665|nr:MULTISPECIES: S41 family peptidase [unclassified Arthrobacter]MCC9197825.1 PDZ domain-containing protein [Arthrobacter sp. zg-Y820]MDK1280692.1 PDZ domain-containing protein [Arthrobacter sp. zg.Y820]WIB10675.1 PDZ domain-containing protein [Arthrobacter sp. zg-Y820]
MSSTPYLRFPDLHDDLVTFVAEDDVWVASLTGGRAWRISSMHLPARNPRFSPDGATIAWSVVQGSAPEVVAADTAGGDFRRLTYWGNQGTRVKGFSAAGNVIAISPFEHEDFRLRWAYEVPLDGSAPLALPYGPVDAVAQGPAVGDERPVVIGSVMTREPAWWKRYRGGTAGKLWIDADGNGEFERLVPELDGNLTDPMWIDGRIVFLSDHEGYGNLYSVTPQGTDLRRHTDFGEFYVRHASTDGHRIVFESAGTLWLLPSLEDDARPLDITLGSAGTGRRPQPLNVGAHLAAVMPDTEGTASVVESHGTLHWLTHRDGPSRVIEADSAVRARLGRPLADGRAVYVADHDGEESLYVRSVFAELDLPDGAASAVRDGQPAASAAAPVPGAAAPAAAEPEIVLPRPVSAATRTPVPVPATAPAREDKPPVAPAGAEPVRPEEDTETSAVPAEKSPRTLRIPFDKPTRVAQITASPDGTAVAVSTEYGEVYLLDPAGGALARIAATGHGAVDQLAFSPDSQWLAWSEPVTGEGARARIRVHSATDPAAGTIEVTDGRFRDHAPAFTVDGRYLAFLSERSFDPVYDTHRFDLSFPSSTKPFLVALAADTPSPFGPSVHGLPVPRAEQPPVSSDDPAEAAPSGPRSVIDAVGISDRIISVPVPQGRYEKLTAADGALLWLASDTYGVTGDGRASTRDRQPAGRLERFDLEKKDVSVLVPALEDYEISGDGRKVVFVHEQQVHAVPSSSRADNDSPENVTVDLTRIRVLLDPLKVWGQEFDEAWRLQRDFFWAPDMGGLDWKGIHARYRPLIDRLGSHDDLVDVLWEMQGELGTSHAYVAPRPAAEPGAGAQGFLGADLRPGPGGWEVVRILSAESSDPQAVSPLAAPGADVHPGDIIAAVDGRPVPADQGPAPLLSSAAGSTVELTIVRTAEDGAGAPSQRRIAVVPLRSEERLRYQNWVAANRRIVREASNGGFGYLHIPDMVANGWSQLHRDLDQESSRNALIVDVRRNRGGHTSQLVAELIGRKVTAWTLARGEQPSTYPAHAPRGPVVILTDEFAGSDGDIITQVAKLRGIGPVIGMRTWGGVVGIDGRFKLVDGTGVNQPRYGFWVTGGIDWTVENYGVDPDIEVPFPPHAYAAGEDPQLEHGVGILKEMLSELPTDQPPALAGYPALQPAPLPPRPQPTPAAGARPGTSAAPAPVSAAGAAGDREAGRH